jgi:hypothetical protein
MSHTHAVAVADIENSSFRRFLLRSCVVIDFRFVLLASVGCLRLQQNCNDGPWSSVVDDVCILLAAYTSQFLPHWIVEEIYQIPRSTEGSSPLFLIRRYRYPRFHRHFGSHSISLVVG